MINMYVSVMERPSDIYTRPVDIFNLIAVVICKMSNLSKCLHTYIDYYTNSIVLPQWWVV